MDTITRNSVPCESCEALMAEEATGGIRTAETQEIIDRNPAHMIRGLHGTPTIEERLHQAERDYAPVHAAYRDRTPNREQLWADWQKRWGTEFDAVCHNVYAVNGL
jgi:hypothetical protein